MGQIQLVRHGQASFGADDYDQLSPLGFEQAGLLGRWLASTDRQIDGAFTGSMKRHQQTAEASLAALPEGRKPAGGWTIDAGFNEYYHEEIVFRHRPDLTDGSAVRRHLAEIAEPHRTFRDIFQAAMERWMGGGHDHEYRESWLAFRDRCVAALHRTIESAGGPNNLIVFTSGGPITAICQHLLEISDRRALELNTSLVNGGVTGLRYRPGKISLSYLNNFAYLEPAGPAKITYS